MALLIFFKGGNVAMVDLKVVVEEVRGFCDLPMKPGDYFEVRGGAIVIPEGGKVCLWALQSLMPLLPLKQRNIAEDNDWVPHTNKIICPDPKGGVVYRIEPLGANSHPKSESQDLPLRIVADPSKCVGCRVCELTCSFVHEGVYCPDMSRIRVEKDELTGKDEPIACHQCGTARCVLACPVGALKRNAVTGAVEVDGDKCIRCKGCAKACPFGAIRFHPESGLPMICDLCGGDPKCVKECAAKALEVRER